MDHPFTYLILNFILTVSQLNNFKDTHFWEKYLFVFNIWNFFVFVFEENKCVEALENPTSSSMFRNHPYNIDNLSLSLSDNFSFVDIQINKSNLLFFSSQMLQSI